MPVAFPALTLNFRAQAHSPMGWVGDAFGFGFGLGLGWVWVGDALGCSGSGWVGFGLSLGRVGFGLVFGLVWLCGGPQNRDAGAHSHCEHPKNSKIRSCWLQICGHAAGCIPEALGATHLKM